MGTGTFVIGIILLGIFILPFMLSGISMKKNRKHMIKILSGVASQNSCNIGEYEFWNNAAISFDETSNWIFFIKKNKDCEAVQCINLNEYKQCKINNKNSSNTKNKDSVQLIEKLELVFTPRDKSKSQQMLVFYDSVEGQELNGEFQLINKWEKNINEKYKLKQV